MLAFNPPTSVHDGAVLDIFPPGSSGDGDASANVYVTVGARDESIAVWASEGSADPLHGRLSLLEERRMYSRDSSFAAACMTRSNSHVATVTADGIVALREVASGAETARCLIPDASADNVGGVVVSHDDQQLFVAVGCVVHVLQVNAARTRLVVSDAVLGGAHGASHAQDSDVSCLGVSPCPMMPISMCTGHVDGSIGFFALPEEMHDSTVWKTHAAPARQCVLPQPTLGGTTPTRATCLVMSPDGSLAAVGTSDGKAQLFDALGSCLILTYDITQSADPVTAIAINPTEFSMACVSGPFIVVCDLESRRCVACDQWKGSDRVTALSYSADGTLLMVGTSSGKLAIAPSAPTLAKGRPGDKVSVTAADDGSHGSAAAAAIEWDADDAAGNWAE